MDVRRRTCRSIKRAIPSTHLFVLRAFSCGAWRISTVISTMQVIVTGANHGRSLKERDEWRVPSDARRDADASTLYPAMPASRHSAQGIKGASAGSHLPRSVETKTPTASTRLVSTTMIYRSFDCASCTFSLSLSLLSISIFFGENKILSELLLNIT